MLAKCQTGTMRPAGCTAAVITRSGDGRRLFLATKPASVASGMWSPAMGRPAVGQEDDHALSHGEFAVAPPAQAHFRNVADQYVDLTMIWMTHARLQQSALAIMKSLGSKIGIRNGHSVPYLFNMVPRRTFGDLRFRSTWPKEPYDVQSRPLGAP